MAQPHEVPHGWMHGRNFKVKKDTIASRFDLRTRESTPFTIPAGTLVKVVMVSRFGDCGITTDLKAENGYTARVDPSELDMVFS